MAVNGTKTSLGWHRKGLADDSNIEGNISSMVLDFVQSAWFRDQRESVDQVVIKQSIHSFRFASSIEL